MRKNSISEFIYSCSRSHTHELLLYRFYSRMLPTTNRNSLKKSGENIYACERSFSGKVTVCACSRTKYLYWKFPSTLFSHFFFCSFFLFFFCVHSNSFSLKATTWVFVYFSYFFTCPHKGISFFWPHPYYRVDVYVVRNCWHFVFPKPKEESGNGPSTVCVFSIYTRLPFTK